MYINKQDSHYHHSQLDPGASEIILKWDFLNHSTKEIRSESLPAIQTN